jgi:hypothetical protein
VAIDNAERKGVNDECTLQNYDDRRSHQQRGLRARRGRGNDAHPDSR